jgi:uncharacterized protein YdhG (YjbR/CyaY superfamily)
MTAPTTIDEYLDTQPERQRACLEEVRAVVHATAPDATEGISYGMPAFKDHGRILVYFAGFKNHWSLFPGSRAVVEAHAAELGDRIKGPGTLRFALDEPVPADLVASIVRDRLAENAAKRGSR